MKRLPEDDHGISALIILVMVVVGAAGAIVVGYLCLNYIEQTEASGFDDNFYTASFRDVEMMPNLNETCICTITVSGPVPLSNARVEINGELSGHKLDRQVGPENAWECGNFTFYFLDEDNDSKLSSGDAFVLVRNCGEDGADLSLCSSGCVMASVNFRFS